MPSKKPPIGQIAPHLAKLAVPLQSLKPDPANLRLHGERSIQGIAASLARFGQQRAILTDKAGVVIGGHGVLEAARSLGWTHVAAARSDLAGVERIAYAIADNRLPELSEWDQPALQAMLGELPADLSLAAGYSADDLSALLAAGGSIEPEQSPIPEPAKEAVSRTGDLWLLGKHRLLCGDCTISADVGRVMAGERAVLFVTDPPYLVGYDGSNHPQSFTGGGSKDWSGSYGTAWDDNDGDSDLYNRFIGAAVAGAIREDAAWYCWHASRRQAMLEAAWAKAGAFVHCQIVWAKNRSVLTRTWYMWQHEPCFFGWIKGKKPVKAEGAENVTTVWNLDVISNGEDRPDHPTPKPIEIFSIPILQHTKPGDLCYEPFAGSGTQIIAAEQLGRRCYALELSPLYIDVIVKRWQTHTGQTARLDGDGRSWEDVAQERAKCHANPAIPATDQAAAPSRTPASVRSTRPSTKKKPPGERPKARPARGGTARRGSASAK